MLRLSRHGRNRERVVSCDAFLEGIHFSARTDPPDSVGYKSLVRATSDLAAMGALPAILPPYTRPAGSLYGEMVPSVSERYMERASRELANSNRRRRYRLDSKVAISI